MLLLWLIVRSWRDSFMIHVSKVGIKLIFQRHLPGPPNQSNLGSLTLSLRGNATSLLRVSGFLFTIFLNFVFFSSLPTSHLLPTTRTTPPQGRPLTTFLTEAVVTPHPRVVTTTTFNSSILDTRVPIGAVEAAIPVLRTADQTQCR